MSSKDSVQRRPTLSAMFLRPKKPAVPDVPVPGGVKHTKEFSLTPEVPVPKEAVARIQKSREFAASLTIKEEPPRQVSRRPSSMQNSVAMQRTASSDSSKSSASSVSTGRKLSMARIQSQSSTPPPIPIPKRMSVVARPSQPEYKPPVPVAMAPRKPRPSSVVQTPAVPAPNLNRKHSVANRVSSLQVPPPGPKREKLMNIRTDVTQSTQATAAEAAPPKKPTTPQSIHSEATQKKPVASDTILKKSSTSEAVQRKPSLISSSVHSPLNTHASYTGESDTDLGSPRRKHSNATTPDITKQMLESVIAELNNTLAIQRSRLEFTTSELDARNLLISELQKAPGLPPNLALAPAQNTSDLLLELELLKTETAKSIGYKNETIDSLRRQLRLKDTSIGNMTSQLAKLKLELDAKTIELQRGREEMAAVQDKHVGEIFGLRKEMGSLDEARNVLGKDLDGLRRQLEALQRENARQKAETDMTQTELAQKTSEMDNLVDSKDAEIAALTKECSRWKAAAESRPREDEVEHLQQKLAEAHEELEALFVDMQSRDKTHHEVVENMKLSHQETVKRQSDSDPAIMQSVSVRSSIDDSAIDSSITQVYVEEDLSTMLTSHNQDLEKLQEVQRKVKSALEAIKISAEEMTRSSSFAYFEKGDVLLKRAGAMLEQVAQVWPPVTPEPVRSSTDSIASVESRRTEHILIRQARTSSILRSTPPPSFASNRVGEFKPSCDERQLRSFISNAMEDIGQERKQIRMAFQEAKMFVIWIESVVSDLSGIQEMIVV